MFKRLLKLPFNQNVLLFRARQTGKSTLLNSFFKKEMTWWIDLLDPEQEERFSRKPNELSAIVKALPISTTHIVIDEIQKVPKLLDVVHKQIESTNKFFVLTSSSARKLKHGGANLLAGRAFVYNLFPLSYFELDQKFDLSSALKWGTLPKISSFNKEEEVIKFLQSYALTYLKEEIWAEQLIKKLDSFRRFLEVSAQCNGKIINYANIAYNVGIDSKTIKEYFIILEDTLIGFFLEPFHNSIRKRLSTKPKFYFFDTGIVRALNRSLTLPLTPRTSAYGESFEHFIILECIKLSYYFNSEFRFSYLRTKDDVEIDLIVERPGLPLLLIEIKSSNEVTENDLRSFIQISGDFKNCEAVCFSNDSYSKQYQHITVMPWQAGLKRFFLKT